MGSRRPTEEQVIDQFAHWIQFEEAQEFGTVKDGRTHPTWEETDPDRQKEFLDISKRHIRIIHAIERGGRIY